MKKKILMVTLAVMAMTALTGCGGKEKDDPDVVQESVKDNSDTSQESAKDNSDVSQENTKDLTVYFGDKECPMDGNLKENLEIYEKNGIIARIGENYYLGNKKLDAKEAVGEFEKKYNEEKGCYEQVMVKKPVYENYPIVKIKAGPADETEKKDVVVCEFSANQASAMSCFPTWELEKEEESKGNICYADYPKESFIIKQEDTDDQIGCGAIIADGTIVDMSKYEEEQGEYSGNFFWDKHYMSLTDVQALSVAAEDMFAKYMDGEIQSLSMIKIWGKNITVSTYTTEEAWKQYQKMLEE